MTAPMHPDQPATSVDLVRRLLAAQHPQWAELPVRPVREAGTDHALYRLGDDLVVRLPVVGWAAGQAAQDARWLPLLGRHLPLAVPVPVALGEPTDEFPWPWSVVPWFAGNTPDRDDLDLHRAAEDLAATVRALHAVPTDGGPAAEGTSRGTPLGRLTEPIAEEIDRIVADDRRLLDGIDPTAVREAWRWATTADEWDRPPVWIHGDIQPGNLVSRDGRLVALIDFGALGVGDPAPDLAPAWNLFSGTARDTFREHVGYAAPTWARAAGWVLAPALTGLRYYAESRPDLVRVGRRHIRSVLSSARA
jgi:aminoglycoside phosphotransferase (APT) family kinase protein